MAPTSRLYDALHDFFSQCQSLWQDVRHLQTLCWMMIGIIQSENVQLTGFGVYVVSRATYAQSHQRRFRRWLSNRRIDANVPGELFPRKTALQVRTGSHVGSRH